MAKQTRDLDWVHRLDGSWLQCRTLRHSWQVDSFQAVPDDEQIRTPRWVQQVIRRVLWCTRCDTRRVELFGRSMSDKGKLKRFQKFRTQYVYPKGYTFRRVDHDGDRPVNNDYTWEQYTRYSEL